MEKFTNPKMGHRIKELRGLRSQEAFAGQVGISQGQLSKYEKGMMPPADVLQRIAEIGNSTVEKLLKGESASATHTESDYAYIPLYDVKAAAGGGAFIETEEIKDLLAFKREWISKELRVSIQDLSIIFADGDSMVPTLNPGDILLMTKDHGKMIQDGIYVIRLEGALLVKRLQRLPGNILKIISDNSIYEPYTIDMAKENGDLAIIGRVVWAGKRF